MMITMYVQCPICERGADAAIQTDGMLECLECGSRIYPPGGYPFSRLFVEYLHQIGRRYALAEGVDPKYSQVSIDAIRDFSSDPFVSLSAELEACLVVFGRIDPSEEDLADFESERAKYDI